MAGCRIDLTLLPLDVALNNHTFSWTSFFTGADDNWGNDLINGNAGQDILIGGAGSDRITGGSGDDDLIGGNTGDAFLGLSDSGGAGGYNAGVDYSAGLIYGDDWDATGGIDGPHSACNTDADCTYGDFLDGGSGNDVLAGDNATILRTGSTAGPRFRVLTGSELMNILGGYANVAGSEYDGTTPCEWFDPNGLVAGSCRTYGYQQDPRGTKQRFVQLYDMDGSTPGTSSDSDLAGGANDDVLSASSATTGSRVTPRPSTTSGRSP